MMRPNPVGWFIVAFFFLGGIAFMIPEETREIWIGQIWVAVSLFLAVVYFLMNRRANQAEELQRTGIPGKAIVKSMTQTGTYINEMPRVKLDLTIQPDGLPPYDKQMTVTVPHIALGNLTQGGGIPIHVDKADRDNIAFDWGTAAPAPAVAAGSAGGGGFGVGKGDPSDRLKELPEAKESGALTDAEFEQKKAQILSEI